MTRIWVKGFPALWKTARDVSRMLNLSNSWLTENPRQQVGCCAENGPPAPVFRSSSKRPDAPASAHYPHSAARDLAKKGFMSQSKPHVDSEEELVTRAQEAVSHCRWVVGECAAQWTERYARGRTDGDFAILIGLTGDQVYQRRRVWETFAENRGDFPSLKWSHFYAALNWDDSTDCLRWAADTHSTVAEMRAWRRAQRGEDLTVDAAEEEAIRYIPAEPEFVQDADYADGPAGQGNRRDPSAGDPDRAVLAGVARQSGVDGEDYTPFRSGAASPGPQAGAEGRPAAEAEPPSTEQLTRRLTGTIERFVKLMTPEFRREFRKLTPEVKDRFVSAVQELRDHVAELK